MRFLQAIGRVLCFYWIWIRGAFRDSFKIANTWSGLWGAALLYAVIWWRGYKMSLPEDPIAQTAVLALLAAGATWVAILIVQFIQEPAQIFFAQKDKIKNLEDQLHVAKNAAGKPHIRLSYAKPETRTLGGGSKATYLYATNEGKNDVTGAQVKIEESLFRRNGSDKWENTSILARHNMSWGDKADNDPQKYAPIQLAPGSEIIDFIEGPIKITYNSGQEFIGFRIRIDPRLWRNVNPNFVEPGTYKFGIQISALDAEKHNLGVLIDWDGKQLIIRCEDDPSQVLETCEVLAV
jgi:hypothetical protein